jgi:hypothetical protein
MSAPNHPIDVLAICAFLASGTLGTVGVAFGQAWPQYAQQIIAVCTLITALAGCVVRVYGNPIGKPATSIIEGAPTVPPNSPPQPPPKAA